MYEIEVRNPKGLALGEVKIFIDANVVDDGIKFIKLVDDGIHHKVLVELF